MTLSLSAARRDGGERGRGLRRRGRRENRKKIPVPKPVPKPVPVPGPVFFFNLFKMDDFY